MVLIWDEMKIKEDSVFDKQTCELVGFTKVGDINNQLDKGEQRQSIGISQLNFATHVLLFMFSVLEFPYAHFATRGTTPGIWWTQCDSILL